jgi:uncharacterized protein (TIGR03000 family)
MFHRLLVFSALGCLFAPALASAQLPFSRQGEYLYREQLQRQNYYGGSQSPGVVEPAPAVESSRAFYPRAELQNRVWMDVTVPANAKIRVEGAETKQTGARRQFESPSLAAGNYRYEIQATWTENGQEVTQRKSFAVQPGDAVRINITRDGVQVKNVD